MLDNNLNDYVNPQSKNCNSKLFNKIVDNNDTQLDLKENNIEIPFNSNDNLNSNLEIANPIVNENNDCNSYLLIKKMRFYHTKE